MGRREQAQREGSGREGGAGSTSSRTLNTPTLPAPAARCKGRSPSVLGASESAPAARRREVREGSPPREEQCRGRLPLLSHSCLGVEERAVSVTSHVIVT